MKKKIDIYITPHQTFYIFHVHSARAKIWLEENCPDAEWINNAIVVEHRYALNLARGMRSTGFIIK